MSSIIAGNKVQLRAGFWTVVFTDTKTRERYNSKAEAIAAAEASPSSTPPESGVQIINGHKVFFDAGRDSWILDHPVRGEIRQADEQTAIAAANALPPKENPDAKENNEVVPKQAVASKVKEKSKATNELDEKVPVSYTHLTLPTSSWV